MTAKQLDKDLINHACSQLAKAARSHVREGMAPASAAHAAIRETKVLFPPDWKLAVQGGDDEDAVEVWEVDHKLSTPCARIERESQAEAIAHLIKAVKERARMSKDPSIRRVAKWSNAKVQDILETAMPDTEHDAFQAIVAAIGRSPRSR